MGQINKLTHFCIKIAIVLLAAILLYSLAELSFLLFKSMIKPSQAFDFSLDRVDRDTLFLPRVQGFISGILLITIIVELIHSLTEYLKDKGTNYLKIIMEIALIAIIRHLLAIDVEHIAPMVLLGISSLILVLALAYMFIGKHLKLPKS